MKNTAEARRSRSIDKAIWEEKLQPWSISDALLVPQGDHSGALFKASLMATCCENKHPLREKVLQAIKTTMESLLEDFIALDGDSLPDEARRRALELQEQLAETDGDITEKTLSMFEYLWGLEELRSLPYGLYGSWPSHKV